MEVKIIKKILTAIGNPVLNNELKKIEEIKVINNDIQYQDGILETLQMDKEIDYIILNQLLPGDYEIEYLVDEIERYNKDIKIILVLDKVDDDIENVLMKKGVYRILYDDKIEINDIIKIISSDQKMEKYNEEIRKEIEELKNYIKNSGKIKNDKKEEKNINKNSAYLKMLKKINLIKKVVNKRLNNNKIIKKLESTNQKNKQIINNINSSNDGKNRVLSILGNNGAGKSIFTVMLTATMKKYHNKILIIDFDILNNSLHTILGVKKYSQKIKEILRSSNRDLEKIKIENLIISINKKIDLISGINLIFDSSNKISENNLKFFINKLLERYDIIIIDTTSECFFEYTKEIIKISDQSIFLTEANLSEISKSKRLLDIYYTNWKIKKEKINIVFNKINKNSIDINLLRKLYSDYKIIGSIKLDKNYNFMINKNIKKINMKRKMMKKYENIEEKIN